MKPYSSHDLKFQIVANHTTVRQFLTKTQINNQVFTLCACMCRWMDMLRCGPAGPKVCVVSVITDSKLPVKYGNLRKRSEDGKIIFAFVSDYFYHYCFHFFRLPLPFPCRPKNHKKLENDFRKSEIIIFVFTPS